MMHREMVLSHLPSYFIEKGGEKMQDVITEYLSIEQIQDLVRKGIMPEYTGWSSCNGFELLYEVRYTLNNNNK